MLRLGGDLRNNGIDVTLDQWDLVPGQDTSMFMQKGIAGADKVLLVCSANYVAKADEGSGGVGYERLVVTVEVVQSIDTTKFIPLVRNNPEKLKVPQFLGPRLYIDFTEDGAYSDKLQELVLVLYGQPRSPKPPLGPNPFSGKLPHLDEPARVSGPTGFTPSGVPLLTDSWFENEMATAINGIKALGLSGHMEIRFGLHEAINKSQIELVENVRKSEINTFGWPIGVTLDNREEYRPRPYGDGVRAEVSINENSPLGRKSYDYWALRYNGDFYLLQSLFEDTRVENQLFFNTRIVRVTESLLFASNLYSNLGVPPETSLSVRVTHRGLNGRVLASSNPSRLLRSSRISREAECQVETVVRLGDIKHSLVDDVQRFTEPLFMLFDFQKFEKPIYVDIIGRFEKGDVS